MHVNNIGGGNCAFYSFAMGLIHIIQSNQVMFEQWVVLDPTVSSSFNDIMSFQFTQQNYKLLNQLQQSLRQIILNRYSETLVDAYNKYTNDKNILPLRDCSIYHKFRLLYEPAIPDDAAPEYNELANSETIRDRIHNIKGQNLNEADADKQLLKAFAILLTANNNDIHQSVIITEGLQLITSNGFWGTFDHLNLLAEAFQVNLHYLRNGMPAFPFKDEPKNPIITINHTCDHWSTEIPISSDQRKSVTAPQTHSPAFYSKSFFELPTRPNNSIAITEKPDVSIKEIQLKKALLKQVRQANKAYQLHSLAIVFSLFNHHGALGRTNADSFKKKVEALANNTKVDFKFLKDFVWQKIGYGQGNTHPHSFRTMLLAELVSQQNNLKDVSERFTPYFKSWANSKLITDHPTSSSLNLR